MKFIKIMQESKDKLKSILSEYFTYCKYKEAIKTIRESFISYEITKDQWSGIKSLIIDRKFDVGEPLSLIALDANLPLNEDTDEEAYKWFDLFVQNIESKNEIIDY